MGLGLSFIIPGVVLCRGYKGSTGVVCQEDVGLIILGGYTGVM